METLKFKLSFFLIVVIFLFIPEKLTSQNIFKKFKTLSCAEKVWVLKHPFSASKALKYTKIAIKIAEKVKKDTILDGDANGGQVDAFRHAYWMAILTQKIGSKKALSLGRAHEKGNYQQFKKNKKEDGTVPDLKACEMDLHNNVIGSEIGKNNINADTNQLKLLIINEIKHGNMLILFKNKKGDYLDSLGNVIPKEKIQAKWITPKHLVKSNTYKP